MKNNNQINVPQAREAMDKFKMQAASDEDVSAAYYTITHYVRTKKYLIYLHFFKTTCIIGNN